MQFDEKYTYPASFDQVWKMYSDPAFTRQRLAEAQLEGLTVDVDGAGTDNLRITASGTVNPDVLPAQVRRFISGALKVTYTEGWRREGDGANGTSDVDVKGAPVHLKAESSLQQLSANETQRHMVGELKIRIPLLGGRLEKQAISFVPMLTKGELAAAKKYLGQ